MIDQDDWVLRFEEPGPNLPPAWKPGARDRKICDKLPNAVRLVARALAKVKQEQSPDAWYHYVGMATTWLADHDYERQGEAAAIAAHPAQVADARRREP